MHNVTVLIQARVGSSRFPQKVLKKIEGKPMIWHVVNRVKQTNLVNQIALVTTKLDEDKKFLDIANELVSQEMKIMSYSVFMIVLHKLMQIQ